MADIFILKLVFCSCFSFSFFIFFLSLSCRNLINCPSFLSFTVFVLSAVSEGVLTSVLYFIAVMLFTCFFYYFFLVV